MVYNYWLSIYGVEQEQTALMKAPPMRSTKIRPTKLLLAFVLNLMAMPAAAQPIQTGPGWNVGRAVLHQPGRAGCLKNLAL